MSSVAVPGTSRSSNLENQGTDEDRPSDDPGPEVEFSSPPHSGAETDPHKNRRELLQDGNRLWGQTDRQCRSHVVCCDCGGG